MHANMRTYNHTHASTGALSANAKVLQLHGCCCHTHLRLVQTTRRAGAKGSTLHPQSQRQEMTSIGWSLTTTTIDAAQAGGSVPKCRAFFDRPFHVRGHGFDRPSHVPCVPRWHLCSGRPLPTTVMTTVVEIAMQER